MSFWQCTLRQAMTASVISIAYHKPIGHNCRAQPHTTTNQSLTAASACFFRPKTPAPVSNFVVSGLRTALQILTSDRKGV